MKLKKIHRVLSFKQSNWLKGFTNFNIEKRRLSNDDFNKNLYKRIIVLITVSMVKVLKMREKNYCKVD